MKDIVCRGVLFDLDGVLVDSTPAVARVWAGWALEHGFDPAEVTHAAHGRPSISTIRDYLPNGNIEAENAEVERREIEDLDGVVPLPGALELMRSLPPHRWTIVTSCTRRLALVRIAAAGLPAPEKIITSTDITRGKPDPEPYIKGAQILGIPPAGCIVIEDAGAGIRAGKAAGARVIALRTTAEDAELTASGADWIVPDCSFIACDFSRGADPFRLLLYS
jgi:mannitol-1-/sugar-/sorbitol-6-phosphatase